MSEKPTLIFKVICSDYDYSNVMRNYEHRCEEDLYYANDLPSRFKNLIQTTKTLREEKKAINADILIVEDDIKVIIKYFKLIEQFIDKYDYPPIENVIACTKVESATYIVNNFNHPNNKYHKPRLIILDFDLQEQKNSGERIFSLAKLIEKSSWHSEILAVSGYKAKKGEFEKFERWLRELSYRTYRKEELDNSSLMMDNLEFLLNREEVQKNLMVKSAKEYGEEKFYTLQRDFGKEKVDATIALMDCLEEGIRITCKKDFKYSPEIHKIPNLTNGNPYDKQNLGNHFKGKKDIFNELLSISINSYSFTKRWEYLEFQVCHFRIFKNHLKCPKYIGY